MLARYRLEILSKNDSLLLFCDFGEEYDKLQASLITKIENYPSSTEGCILDSRSGVCIFRCRKNSY